MRFSFYQGARGGVRNAIDSLAKGAETERNAYNKTLRDLAYVDSAQATARNADSKTALNRQTYEAGERMMSPEMQAAIQELAPDNIDPGLYTSGWMASKDRTFGGFTKGFQNLGAGNATMQALDAALSGDVDAMNRLNTVAKPGTQYKPYTLTETGRVNGATGDVAFTPGHEALVRSRDAAARASDSTVRANDALARQRGFMTVSPGADVLQVPNTIGEAMETLYRAPYSPRQQGAGEGGANISPNAQLMKAFSRPAADESGAPIMDPLTGKQAVSFDASDYDQFLRWYASNRPRFPDINEGILAYKTQPREAPAADPLAEARAAIAKGAPRAAVIARLKQLGIDPRGL